jgi:hypothetical protein
MVKREELKVGQIVQVNHPANAVILIEEIGENEIIGYRMGADLSCILKNWGAYSVKLSDIIGIVAQPGEAV